MNRYASIIKYLFKTHYSTGATDIAFTRQELVEAASRLKIVLPKNLGDIIYSFRYRATFPDYIQERTPKDKRWIIVPRGTARYAFLLTSAKPIQPSPSLILTKIPDATPGIITRYALNDEQALLAKIRYNRLLDIFTGVTCYALQSHLRTQVPDIGQVETDEVYVGVDRRGVHFVFPVQAKGGRDKVEVVQILQDLRLCEHKFPGARVRPIAAQFVEDGSIALFELAEKTDSIRVVAERHYHLVPQEQISQIDLAAYKSREV